MLKLDLTVDIPQDILIEVFSRLSSKERSLICSVSKQFETVVIATSMRLYPSKYWLEPYVVSPKIIRMSLIKQFCLADIAKYSIFEVFGDYHLTARVKPDDAELHYACAKGDLDVVITMYFIDRKKITSVEYTLAFNMACASGNRSVVEYLLSLGYKNTSSYHGADYAAYNGHLELMKLLLDHPDVTTTTYNKCLQDACNRGHTDIIKYLVDSQKIDDDGEYWALHNSGYYGHLASAKYLIDVLKHGTMVVVDSAVRGKQMNIVSELLYSEPLTQNDFDVLWRSACERGGKKMIDYLIKTLAPGLVINYNDGLYSAYFGEKDKIADYLISLGAVDGPNMWGWHERHSISDSDNSDSSSYSDS